jgi:hypothetical protein
MSEALSSVCGTDFLLFIFHFIARRMLMLKGNGHLPTPMPTSTINPREISDTISLFTENEAFQPEHKRRLERKGLNL